MKILVLMPLDEKSVYMAAGIQRHMDEKTNAITFSMPMFMQYAVATKVSKNWEYATLDTLVTAASVYNAAQQNDLIVIGNMPDTYKFDKVFNFQDIDEDLPYKDLFVEKLQEVCKTEPTLMKWVGDLHKADESIFTLHNCEASAHFLEDYIQTDPHVDEIRAKYADRLEFKDAA